MIVIGCDPGPTRSSFVCFDGGRVRESIELPNEDALGWLAGKTRAYIPHFAERTVFAIEQIESMGMAVGRDIFETVFWSGRFVERVRCEFVRVTRRQVKLHLSGTMRAKDKNIRQALVDRFGGDSVAVGTKKAPGPLYGVASHRWSALAVAVTYWDNKDAPATVSAAAETTEF